MKINLIYPECRRLTSNLSTNTFHFLATAHSGLPILGEILQQEGHQVKVFAESIFSPSDEELFDCDVLGISIQTISAFSGYKIAQRAKEKGIPTIIGGVHATLNPEEAINYADYVIRGEAEKSLPQLLKNLNKPQNLQKIKGLSYWQNKKIIHNPAAPLLKNEELNKVPIPNWKLIEGWEDIFYTPVNNLIYFTQATRGCPFDCNFCSVTKSFGQSLRHRSVDLIIEELKHNRKKTQEVLFFVDDSIGANKNFLKELLEAMLKKNCVPKIGWHSQMRQDVAKDKELLKLMKLTNCLMATFGFESINPATLKYMKKSQTVDDIKNCIKAMHDIDVFVTGFFVFGSDEDTVDTIRDTVEFAKKEQVDFGGFMPMTPFPGTPFFTEMEKAGRIFSKDWELYDVEHVVYFPKKMTPYELYTETLKCYKIFYTPAIKFYRYEKFLKKMKIFDPLTPFYLSMLTAWPLMKRWHYEKELLANKDYLQALYNISYNKKTAKDFPILRNSNLWLHDLLTARNLKKSYHQIVETPFKVAGKILGNLGMATKENLLKVENKLDKLL